MAVYGIVMMRDEEDVAEGVLRHMADECDRLLIADNLSNDGTREILDRLAVELHPALVVVEDREVAYRQSEKMTNLAVLAATMLDEDDWTVIVPFDADELWWSRDGRLRDVLHDWQGGPIAARLHHHIRTGADLDDPDPFRSMIWRQDRPAQLPKVAFRWEPGAIIHQGNHSVTLPMGRPCFGDGLLEVCHFPVRSLAQFHRKAINGGAAYAAAPDIQGGDHWKSWAQLTAEQREEAYRTYWHFPSPTDVGLWSDIGLIREPAPYRRWEAGAEPTPEAEL